MYSIYFIAQKKIATKRNGWKEWKQLSHIFSFVLFIWLVSWSLFSSFSLELVINILLEWGIIKQPKLNNKQDCEQHANNKNTITEKKNSVRIHFVPYIVIILRYFVEHKGPSRYKSDNVSLCRCSYELARAIRSEKDWN